MRPCTPLTLRLSSPVRGPARPVGPQRYRELLADVLRQRDWPVALGTVPGTKGGSQDGSTTPSWSRGSPWRAEAHEVAVDLDAEPLKIQYVIEVCEHVARNARELTGYRIVDEPPPCVTSRPPSRPWAG